MRDRSSLNDDAGIVCKKRKRDNRKVKNLAEIVDGSKKDEDKQMCLRSTPLWRKLMSSDIARSEDNPEPQPGKRIPSPILLRNDHGLICTTNKQMELEDDTSCGHNVAVEDNEEVMNTSNMSMTVCSKSTEGTCSHNVASMDDNRSLSTVIPSMDHDMSLLCCTLTKHGQHKARDQDADMMKDSKPFHGSQLSRGRNDYYICFSELGNAAIGSHHSGSGRQRSSEMTELCEAMPSAKHLDIVNGITQVRVTTTQIKLEADLENRLRKPTAEDKMNNVIGDSRKIGEARNLLGASDSQNRVLTAVSGSPTEVAPVMNTLSSALAEDEQGEAANQTVHMNQVNNQIDEFVVMSGDEGKEQHVLENLFLVYESRIRRLRREIAALRPA